MTSAFTYQDGQPIQIGDSVLLENGKTDGVIELIVVTQAEMQAINVTEPGVMLISQPFGRVYLPEWSLLNAPLQLVSRGSPA